MNPIWLPVGILFGVAIGIFVAALLNANKPGWEYVWQVTDENLALKTQVESLRCQADDCDGTAENSTDGGSETCPTHPQPRCP